MARKLKIPRGGAQFTANMLENLAADMRAGRLKVPRLLISDNVQPGLRAIIRRGTGAVSFHAHYFAPDGSRPMVLIGGYPETSIAVARAITKTILALVERKIDPIEGMRARLMRELYEKGTSWRP